MHALSADNRTKYNAKTRKRIQKQRAAHSFPQDFIGAHQAMEMDQGGSR
jgi:hypothetical protein